MRQRLGEKKKRKLEEATGLKLKSAWHRGGWSPPYLCFDDNNNPLWANYDGQYEYYKHRCVEQ